MHPKLQPPPKPRQATATQMHQLPRSRRETVVSPNRIGVDLPEPDRCGTCEATPCLNGVQGGAEPIIHPEHIQPKHQPVALPREAHVLQLPKSECGQVGA
uniref:Uncharacterized protein n=1 Tax=Opuntia streptacantha TaxID=393608 RepID=A0A7C9CJN6_OPUST